MSESEGKPYVRAALLGSGIRAVIEGAVGVVAIFIYGLLLELVVPDTHSHGSPVVLPAVILLGSPALACLVVARAAKRVLEVCGVNATRLRFLPRVLHGLAAGFAAVLLAGSIWVVASALLR